MHHLKTTIEINASCDVVWSVITDFAAYPRWNPFVRSIEGGLMVGETLNVSLQPPKSRGMRFRPVLLTVEPNRELRWKGKLLFPGLFDGEHYFKLQPLQNGSVAFDQGEEFSGLLVPLFRSSLDGATRQGFIAMNEALKQEAEKRGA